MRKRIGLKQGRHTAFAFGTVNEARKDGRSESNEAGFLFLFDFLNG